MVTKFGMRSTIQTHKLLRDQALNLGIIYSLDLKLTLHIIQL